MKLKAEIENEDYDIDIVRDGRDVTATVNGRTYQLDASQPEPNVYLLKNENRIFEISVSRLSNDNFQVRSHSNELEITVFDPKRLRGSNAESSSIDGKAEIRTAMPGKLVRIIAPAGTEVQKGDGVVVVEAMKMQNELRSPKDGVIQEIRFEEGATVNSGDILAVIE